MTHDTTPRLQTHLPDAEATHALGLTLGQCLSEPMVIYLEGDLGAGKTALCQALLRGLGYQGKVKSPTYTLVEEYHVTALEILHFDLYRLAHPDELDYIGGYDYFSGKALCLIEWPERGAGWLPSADGIIRLSVAATGRDLAISAPTAKGQAWLKRVHKLG